MSKHKASGKAPISVGEPVWEGGRGVESVNNPTLMGGETSRAIVAFGKISKDGCFNMYKLLAGMQED